MATVTPTDVRVTTEVVRRELSGDSMDRAGKAFSTLLLASLLITLALLFILLVSVVNGAFRWFAERGFGFLTDPISLNEQTTGIGQAIQGSIGIGLFTIVVAFPLGIAAAIYLEEYAGGNRLARFIDVNIRNLAGVPSVVYGILGLSLFVEALGTGRTLLAAGLTIAILVLPIVIITSAEAIRAVPDSIREAGFAVGATRWETVRSHVLPYAAPGILTGTVLSLARALGEAAPLIVVGATTGFLQLAGDPGFFARLSERYATLPTQIFAFAGQPADIFRSRITPGAILVLLLLTLAINSVAIVLRNRYDTQR